LIIRYVLKKVKLTFKQLWQNNENLINKIKFMNFKQLQNMARLMLFDE